MRILFTITFFVLGTTLYAQQSSFLTEFGGMDVIQTTDSGFVVTGSGLCSGCNAGMVRLNKIKINGDTLWSKYHGDGIFGDIGHGIEQTTDGGYIIGGMIGKPDTMMEGSSDVIVIRTNNFGDTIWTKTWGLIPDTLPDEGLGDIAYSVLQTLDNNYVVAGMYNYSLNWTGVFPPTAFLVKLDTLGNILWNKTYPQLTVAYSVIQIFDGGYAFCGQSGLVRTNSSGDTIWSKPISGICRSIIQCSDSNLIVTGGNGDIFLSKLDLSGNTIWSKNYDRGCNDNDYAYSIDECINGGFIIVGGTYCSDFSQFANTDIWLVRTDSNGDTLWTKNYGTSGNDEGYSVKQCYDDGFIITGNTTVGMFLLKTDSLGNAPTLDFGIKLPTMNEVRINIYPNPASGKFIIECEFNKKILLILYDILGNIIASYSIDGFKEIDINNIFSGIYFYRIFISDNNIVTGKLIVY